MCTVAFFGFLRCGEFTCSVSFDADVNLCVQDVICDYNRNRCILTLKTSKTNPFRLGVAISLFATNKPACLVRSLSQLILIRRKCGAQAHDPLFLDSCFHASTRTTFLRWLNVIMCRIGLSSKSYSGHSFRIGAATTAAQVRMEDHLIKTLGRWSSICFTRYIRTPEDTLRQAQISLCNV
ncbi:uncharacterized protein LOC125384145 [Haliotis rufescens]|uniref:uncharacterized protein LOC125384145 n=1 Tax=Haliotis rufescens TaxID=6454 RepID=UPI00201EC23C|nr:uncharacterized protein LOC125384145 [Haliotis rufescens]